MCSFSLKLIITVQHFIIDDVNAAAFIRTLGLDQMHPIYTADRPSASHLQLRLS